MIPALDNAQRPNGTIAQLLRNGTAVAPTSDCCVLPERATMGSFGGASKGAGQSDLSVAARVSVQVVDGDNGVGVGTVTTGIEA
jgi:hypothetical protein